MTLDPIANSPEKTATNSHVLGDKRWINEDSSALGGIKMITSCERNGTQQKRLTANFHTDNYAVAPCVQNGPLTLHSPCQPQENKTWCAQFADRATIGAVVELQLPAMPAPCWEQCLAQMFHLCIPFAFD
jgi:hypothetical protein